MAFCLLLLPHYVLPLLSRLMSTIVKRLSPVKPVMSLDVAFCRLYTHLKIYFYLFLPLTTLSLQKVKLILRRVDSTRRRSVAVGDRHAKTCHLHTNEIAIHVH